MHKQQHRKVLSNRHFLFTAHMVVTEIIGDGGEHRLNAYISPIYDDNFLSQFGELSEEHKQMVWNHMKKVMDWLKDDSLEEYFDIKVGKAEAPIFLSEKYFDFQQLTIPNFN